MNNSAIQLYRKYKTYKLYAYMCEETVDAREREQGRAVTYEEEENNETD